MIIIVDREIIGAAADHWKREFKTITKWHPLLARKTLRNLMVVQMPEIGLNCHHLDALFELSHLCQKLSAAEVGERYCRSVAAGITASSRGHHCAPELYWQLVHY